MVPIHRKSFSYTLWLSMMALLGLTGLFVGFFQDYAIDYALYSPGVLFGRIFYVIGPLPCLFALTLAGILLCYAASSKGLLQRIGAALIMILLTGGSLIYLSGSIQEMFSLGKISSFLISIPICLPVPIWAFFKIRGQESGKLIVLGVYLLITAGGSFLLVSGIKEIWARPRFWAMLENTSIPFHSWLQISGTLPSRLASEYGVISDAFKSFPSAHTATAAVSLSLPVVACWFKGQKKNAEKLVIIAVLFIIITAYSRLVMGAHYLSDVSAGLLIAVLFEWLGFVWLRKKDPDQIRGL